MHHATVTKGYLHHLSTNTVRQYTQEADHLRTRSVFSQENTSLYLYLSLIKARQHLNINQNKLSIHPSQTTEE